MKTIIMIIVLNGLHGESVAIDHIEFDTMDHCLMAAIKLGAVERKNKGYSMRYIQGTYTCIKSSRPLTPLSHELE